MVTNLLSALVCVLYMAKEAGSCPPENIPVFEDTSRTELPGPVWAIVPAYNFTCHGNITLWGACLQPGGGRVEQYDILFQVFRPSSDGVGCYDLIGSNFLNDADPSSVEAGGIERCVVLTDIPPEGQIQVQPGDVVGFYAVHYRDGQQSNGGVQLDTDVTTVIVWSTESLAITEPDTCPYRIGDDGNLASSTAAAPVITAQVVPITPPALATPTSSSTSLTPSLSHTTIQPRSTLSQLRSTLSQPWSTLSQPRSTLSQPQSTLSQPSRSTLSQPQSTLSQPQSTLSQPRSTLSQPRSTLSQPQPPVPSSTNPPVSESTINEFTTQNLIVIYGAIGGAVGLVLIVATICVVVIFRKKRGVVNIFLQDSIQTKGNEAYAIYLTSFAIPTSQNEAYSAVQPVDNQLTYEEPSTVEANIPAIPTAQNEAYGAVQAGGADIEYDYVMYQP